MGSTRSHWLAAVSLLLVACGGGAAAGSAGNGGTSGTAGSAGSGGTTGSAGIGGNSGGNGPGGAAGNSGGNGSGGGGSGGAGGSSGGGGGSTGVVSLAWDFTSDAEGWTGHFCDYPPGGISYDLDFGWAPLPSELGAGNGGLRITGNNHSDDLFMYVTRRIDGLRPSSRYLVDVDVDIGTNAPADCGGIGGAPGTSVFLKIGLSPLAPMTSADSLGWLRLNLDKGNQSAGGADLKVVGDISNTLSCPKASYQRKRLSLTNFPVQTASDGTVSVIIGTDSGFEGITVLYYDRISATLRPTN